VVLQLGTGEPVAGPWHVESLAGFVHRLEDMIPAPVGRPRIVAIDGRSGSGKTTLAKRMADLISTAAVVETDDISWYFSRFDWADRLRDGVLIPLRRGEGVHYRLPDSPHHGEMGHLSVPADASWVLVEGVGSSRRALTELLDGSIWVQSDAIEADRRGILRNGGDARAARRWSEWMAEEQPFIEADRPWERATVIVAGTTDVPHDPIDQLVLAPACPWEPNPQATV
jgi:energy-coupling factor transporter ATP-binding protein EcfA2